MKFLFSLITLLFLSSSSWAQSLTVRTAGESSANPPSVFTVNGVSVEPGQGSLSISDREYSGSIWSVDPNAMGVILRSDSVYRIAQNGSVIYRSEYRSAGDDDPSVKLYAAYDGGFVIRENIANFLIYGPTGTLLNSVSNSTGSQEGESISELAADPYFKTVALYNPEYRMNGESGSRVQIADGNSAREIFNDPERTISKVQVSDDGQLLAIATVSGSSDDRVHIIDRYGNALNSFAFSQEIEGFSFSGDNEFLTVYSGGRVVVYESLSGERVGSTSVRSVSVRAAQYFPEDQCVVIAASSRRGNTLSDVELRVVNIDRRSIASEDFGQVLGISDAIPLNIRRDGSYRYTLLGLSKHLEIRASF